MNEVEKFREWLAGLIELPPAARVVDLGCGRGQDLRVLAARNGDPDARFLGLDASEKHIAAGIEATSDTRINFRVERLGVPLGLPDAGFDVVLTNDLLECIGDAEGFVDEIARVLRPGGTVVASHSDWGTQTYSSSDRDRTRRVMRGWSEWKQSWMDHADPWMGRKLWGLFEHFGHFEGRLEARTITSTVFAEGHHGYDLAQGYSGLVRRGLVSEDDYNGFLQEQSDLAEAGKYFWSTTRFVYVGKRVSTGPSAGVAK